MALPEDCRNEVWQNWKVEESQASSGRYFADASETHLAREKEEKEIRATLYRTFSFSDICAAHPRHTAGRLFPLQKLFEGIFQRFHFCADFLTRPNSTLMDMTVAQQRVALYCVQECTM